MSTALNSFWPDPKTTGLMAGNAGGYDYADLLKEQFEPDEAYWQSLEILIEVVERWLEVEGDEGEDNLSVE